MDTTDRTTFPPSRLLNLAIASGLLDAQTSFFDATTAPIRTPADVVSLGYAIDGLTSAKKRQQTLQKAWKYTQKVLLLAATVRLDTNRKQPVACGDSGIFPCEPQQFLTHAELHADLDRVLDGDVVPASIGIFFIFRDRADKDKFIASQFADESGDCDEVLYLAFAIVQQPTAALYPLPLHQYEAVEELLFNCKNFEEIAKCCQQSPLGKKLPSALYVHTNCTGKLPRLLRLYDALARRSLGYIDSATVVKFSTDKPQISYLVYPDFDTDPHPMLRASFQIDTQTQQLTYRDYQKSANPPVLHRKETFVTPDYPHYDKFTRLTEAEDALGLLDNTRGIGTLRGWRQCLQDYSVEIREHSVIEGKTAETNVILPEIYRHRAAMVRTELSRPVRLALEVELIDKYTTFFDYGCGYGGDVTRLANSGYKSYGWDPYYAKSKPVFAADVVNLGYVINVIENQAERRETLIKAWDLTRSVLIVSAQVLIDDRDRGVVAYGDGIITSKKTFQKYYEQEELKEYIDRVLGVDAIAIGLGVYLVFRDEERAETFRASRWRSFLSTPRIFKPSKRFEDYEHLLLPLMEFIRDRGRLPRRDELENESALLAEFGTFRRAFNVILQVTDEGEWETIAEQRRQDILVYLALIPFRSRGGKTKLTQQIKNDIKLLFGRLQDALWMAEDLLFSVGDLTVMSECCDRATVGRRSANSLTVHLSALSALDPHLRVYEGCASGTVGRMEGTTLVKFHTKVPKISYLSYPEFDSEAHPRLYQAMQVDLRDLRISYRDYEISKNPPVLHRKETLVLPDYPKFAKFAKLSQQEENWGLLDNLSAARSQREWEERLQDFCAEIRGDRLYFRKDADPYRVKLLKAAIRQRKKGQLSPEE